MKIRHLALLWPLFAPLAGAAGAAGAASTGSVECPYSAAELKTALGITTAAGKAATPLGMPGGRRLSCRYDSRDGKGPALWLTQFVFERPDAPALAEMRQASGGTPETVAGDGDEAQWLDAGAGNLTLRYVRQGHLVELRLIAGGAGALNASLKPRLLKLRRLPP